MINKEEWTWTYGSAYHGISNFNEEEFHNEKMRTLLTLITRGWHTGGKIRPFVISCGKYAEAILTEAILSQGYNDDFISFKIRVDDQLPDDILKMGDTTIKIESNCSIPYYHNTPYEKNESLIISKRIVEDIKNRNIDTARNNTELLLKLLSEK